MSARPTPRLLLAATLLVAGASAKTSPVLAQAEKVAPEPAPAYGFPTYERFDDFADDYLAAGHPDTTYVVNFWATWCGPCVKELPYFERLHAERAAADQPVRVTLVTIDLPMAYERSLLPFLAERQLRAEVVGLRDGDANAWIDRVDPSWSGAIPITLVRRGDRVRFFEKAYHSYAELLADLE